MHTKRFFGLIAPAAKTSFKFALVSLKFWLDTVAWRSMVSRQGRLPLHRFQLKIMVMLRQNLKIDQLICNVNPTDTYFDIFRRGIFSSLFWQYCLLWWFGWSELTYVSRDIVAMSSHLFLLPWYIMLHCQILIRRRPSRWLPNPKGKNSRGLIIIT